MASRRPTLNFTTKGPMWGYPRFVLGAIGSFLEPFCGHLSPKIDKVSEELTLRYPHEGPWVEEQVRFPILDPSRSNSRSPGPQRLTAMAPLPRRNLSHFHCAPLRNALPQFLEWRKGFRKLRMRSRRASRPLSSECEKNETRPEAGFGFSHLDVRKVCITDEEQVGFLWVGDSVGNSDVAGKKHDALMLQACGLRSSHFQTAVE